MRRAVQRAQLPRWCWCFGREQVSRLEEANARDDKQHQDDVAKIPKPGLLVKFGRWCWGFCHWLLYGVYCESC